jgi:Subtilase family
MRHLSLFGFAAAVAAATVACSRDVAPPSGAPGSGGVEERAPLLPGSMNLDLSELEREAQAIMRSAAAPVRERSEVSEPRGRVAPPPSFDVAPPRGATAHPALRDAELTPVDAAPLRMKRAAEKLAIEGARPLPPPKARGALSFIGTTPYEPRRGIDDALLAPNESVRARGFTYAFMILNEYLAPESEKELNALGVEVLGPHGAALKVRAPAEPDRLRQVAALPFVEWIGHARPEQKLGPPLREAMQQFARELPGFPVTINAFDDAAVRELQPILTRGRATVGRIDPHLNAVLAVVPAELLEQLARLDNVLFIELNAPGGGGHDNSMAVMGADYIRPGGPGIRFSGAPTILGIMDTGFMVGGAAPTTHQDLNKFGCGRNFTSDAAGVWNDQNGHGTHVLASSAGTGTAEARFRGASPGIGASATTRIRAAKIWDSTNNGTQADELEGHDYMDDASDCGSGRPQVVNISGGMTGTNLPGTDARSRKLDQIVWATRQTWVLCSGNSGPGTGTIWAAGVAKNALTVGNVLDTGDGTIGDIRNTSSRGPTGDGRMKPNVVGTGTTIRSANAGTTNGYTNMVGCSMATPHVSGIAASVMEHYPEFRGLPHLMRAHLMATALLHDNVAAPLRNTEAPDTTRNTFGLGRVSPYAAHWAHANAAGWTTHWAWRTITRERWGFRDIEVPSGTARLVVVLAWDEPAASAGATSAVDYDLDLWIDRAPFCTPDSVGQCGEWASQSWIDNVEYQIIENPPPGTYRLKIVNWNAPSWGLPAAVSATIIRGATAPNMNLSVTASTINPGVGGRATITTTVSNPSWILSGVHLQSVSLPPGVTIESVRTTREDNVVMDFTADRAMSLGNIVQGDSRSATWQVRIDSGGPKEFRFRARSENGGVREQSIILNPGTT